MYKVKYALEKNGSKLNLCKLGSVSNVCVTQTNNESNSRMWSCFLTKHSYNSIAQCVGVLLMSGATKRNLRLISDYSLEESKHA